MKAIKFFAVALATVALASCAQNEESAKFDDTKKSVAITIVNQTAPAARATQGEFTGTDEENWSTGAAVAKAENLTAMFANAAGEVLSAIDLADVEAEDIDGKVYTFHLLDPAVTQVAITNTSNAEAAEGSLAAAKARTKVVSTQQGGLENVLVWGETALTAVEGGEDNHDGVAYNLYKGSMTIAPELARIEIGNITCEDLGVEPEEGETAPRFAELNITKIGIHNTVSTVTNGVPVNMDVLYAYDEDNWETGLAAWQAAEGWNVDETEFTLNADNMVYGDEDGEVVFAYNVAPMKVPFIILEATTGEKNPAFPAGVEFPYYVKSVGLNNFGDVDFARGSIYRVSFKFNCDNVRQWFESDEYICADVTVNIRNWTIAPISEPTFE